ncbi:MAG: hypothetical protein M1822_008227 [Bathelium mastoideum]|nr:MAG: hypothetical protein M1822_008227 [Bathelium mastoideum]
MGSASPFPLLLLSFLSLASASPIYQQPFPHNEYMEPRETSYMNFWVSTKDFSTPFYTGYDVCDTSLHSSALPWDAQLSSYIQRSNGSCVSQGSYDINMDGLSAAYFAVMPQEEDLDVCMGEVRFQSTGRYAACMPADITISCGDTSYRQFAECRSVGTY